RELLWLDPRPRRRARHKSAPAATRRVCRQEPTVDRDLQDLAEVSQRVVDRPVGERSRRTRSALPLVRLLPRRELRFELPPLDDLGRFVAVDLLHRDLREKVVPEEGEEVVDEGAADVDERLRREPLRLAISEPTGRELVEALLVPRHLDRRRRRG